MYVGGYGGLNESGLCVFCKSCPVGLLVVGKSLPGLLQSIFMSYVGSWMIVHVELLISGEYVCCSVVFGILIGVSMFSVIWLALLIISDISCPLCIDVLSRGGIYMFGMVMSLVLLISTMTI